MDARTRRRCAALAVFEPLLGEAELIDTLWLCEDHMGGESVTDILRYVDLVGERHGLDAGTRKRLYGALHAALRRDEHDLPLDPWPVMAALRPGQTAALPSNRPTAPQPPSYPAPSPAPLSTPAAAVGKLPASPDRPAAAAGSAWSGALGHTTTWAPASYGLNLRNGLQPAAQVAPPTHAPAATAVAGPALHPAAEGPVATPAVPAAPGSPVGTDRAATGVPAAAPAMPVTAAEAEIDDDPSVPAVQRVFADIVDALAAEVAQSHAADHAEWVQACSAQLQRSLAGPDGAAALASLAADTDRRERRRVWRLPRPAAGLSALLTEHYVCLCEALGPVAADQVLNRAVRAAEQRPAAREFPPRRLL